MVSRNRVTTRRFAAIAIRSWLREILATAATISGVSPGANAASVSSVAASESSQSRNSPTVKLATGAKAAASWPSTMSPRHLVFLIGNERLAQKGRQRQIGERHLRGDALGGAFRRDAREAIAGA